MDFTSIAPIAIAFVGALVTFYLVALLVRYLTEVTKGGSRVIAKLPALSWVNINGLGSVLTALVISFMTVVGPTGATQALTSLFSSFGVTVDEKAVAIFAGLLSWVISTQMHDSGKLPEVLPPSNE